MLVHKHDKPGDYQELHRFNNGYGVSIVNNLVSYGGKHFKFEVAIIKWGKDRFNRDTWDFGPPIFNNNFYVGWLTLDQALCYAIKVQNLPKPELWEKWYTKHMRKGK